MNLNLKTNDTNDSGDQKADNQVQNQINNMSRSVSDLTCLIDQLENRLSRVLDIPEGDELLPDDEGPALVPLAEELNNINNLFVDRIKRLEMICYGIKL